MTSTVDHRYGHVSRGAASALAVLRSLRHRHGYASVARLASAAWHHALRTRTYGQRY
jgi:hypothetical protein